MHLFVFFIKNNAVTGAPDQPKISRAKCTLSLKSDGVKYFLISKPVSKCTP